MLEIAKFPGQASVGPSRSAKHRLGEPVAELSAWLLGKLHRRVAKRGDNIKGASLPELHELRKAIKNLRYGIEFLTPLYSARKVKTALKPCRELQDLLGRVNDGAGSERLTELLLAASSGSGLADAVAEIRKWAERRGEKAHDHLLKPWQKLREAAPFW